MTILTHNITQMLLGESKEKYISNILQITGVLDKVRWEWNKAQKHRKE